jgi:hypothetical protein
MFSFLSLSISNTNHVFLLVLGIIPSSSVFLVVLLPLFFYYPIFLYSSLVALSPLALAPIRRTTKVLPRTAEVASRTAQPISTLPVHNRSASLALTRDTFLGSGLSRRLLVVAFSEAGLAAVSTVKVLVLDVVLGSTWVLLVLCVVFCGVVALQ